MDLAEWIQRNVRRFLSEFGRNSKCYALVPLSRLNDQLDNSSYYNTTKDDEGITARRRRNQTLHGIEQATNELLVEEFGQRHDLDKNSSWILIETPRRKNTGQYDLSNMGLDESDFKVVGHVKIQEKKVGVSSTMKLTKSKALAMLQRGVPRVAVEQTWKMQQQQQQDEDGVEQASTSFDEFLENGDGEVSENLDDSDCYYYVDGLVIHPSYRGLGLGRNMIKAAVAIVVVCKGGKEIRALAASKELAAWYERMGAHRATEQVYGKRAKENQKYITLDTTRLIDYPLPPTKKEIGLDESGNTGAGATATSKLLAEVLEKQLDIDPVRFCVSIP